MANLLVETKEVLKQFGKAVRDVEWVGSRDGKKAISWQTFTKIANFDYDDGYGGNQIAMCLVVVGSDWWLERHEYDGSEWWEFKSRPTKKADAVKFTNVRNDSYKDELQ